MARLKKSAKNGGHWEYGDCPTIILVGIQVKPALPLMCVCVLLGRGKRRRYMYTAVSKWSCVVAVQSRAV